MKQAVSQETNRANLRYTANLLNSAGIEWFIFFGTLLGLTRDNDVIKGDDDIDIYVDSRYRTRLIELLDQQGLVMDLTSKPNHTQHFLQITRMIEGETGLIDFYFFDGEAKPNILVDRWNFLQKYAQSAKAIHVPKEFALPIVRKFFFDTEINFPQKPKELCRWLYGEGWERPLSKTKEYEMTVIGNEPKLVYRLPRKIERFIPKFLRGAARSLFLTSQPVTLNTRTRPNDQ